MVSIREKNHRYIVVYYVTDDAGGTETEMGNIQNPGGSP